MRNALVVARRELVQTFRSPLAYVFLVLFVVLVPLPHLLSVFQIGRAELRVFFDTLPWFVMVFASLVTMRSWAEERQGNTFELLLTFPMRDRELVLGKFLGALGFLTVALALTCTLPVMLFFVGDPDPGPILSGYLGAFLLAAMWSAVGVFFSSLTRSQLLAALASFVFGLFSLALGMDSIMVLVDAKLPGLGVALDSVFGVWDRYATFTRGVVEAADVLYFVAWIVLLLHLNTFVLGQTREAGRREGERISPRGITAAAVALTLGCAALVGRMLHETSLARADLTEERLFTLSKGTLDLFDRADVPVRAKLYISSRDDLPPHLRGLEQEILDRLSEIRVASGGKLEISVVHPSARERALLLEDTNRGVGGSDGTRTLEERLADKGVLPFTVRSHTAAQVSARSIYSSLGLTYRERDEAFVHGLLPVRVPGLEYEIATIVEGLVRGRAPRIALYLGPEFLEESELRRFRDLGVPVPDPYARVAALLRAERYDVQRITFDAYDPLPPDYDALVMIAPVGLEPRQVWELNRALVTGRPVLLAVQRYTWEFHAAGQGGFQSRRRTEEPGVEEVLAAQGLGVSRGILMDQVVKPYMQGRSPVNAPMHVRVTDTGFADESPISRQLSSVFYPWGTAIEMDRRELMSRLLEFQVLARSSDRSWEVPHDRAMRLRDLGFTEDVSDENRRPLVVLVKGNFQDAFAGRPRPPWEFRPRANSDGNPLPVPRDLPEQSATPAPGTLLLTGCARMWANRQLASEPDNRRLLLNALNALTASKELLAVRAKEPRTREFDRPSDAAARLWTILVIALVPLAVIASGLLVGLRRVRGRDAWNRRHGR